MRRETVLVTGGAGFVGAHCILQLLQSGYRVRTTLRSLGRKSDVLAMLEVGGIPPGEMLSFVAADLTSDGGWSDAVSGCDYVLHVASPFPAAPPTNEDDIIVPARDGALRVLSASRDAGVKRVVLTSSFAAVGYSPKRDDTPYSESDWTDPDQPGLGAYIKSKTLSERAAWDFIAREGGDLELSVVLPTGIFGPALSPNLSTSIQIIKLMLDGELLMPSISFGVIDARDVAELHLLAMTTPAAKGERYLAVAGESVTMRDVAQILKSRLTDIAAYAKTPDVPGWIARTSMFLDITLNRDVPDLEPPKNISSEKARKQLNWTPRPNEEALVATGASLARLGLLRSQGGVGHVA